MQKVKLFYTDIWQPFYPVFKHLLFHVFNVLTFLKKKLSNVFYIYAFLVHKRWIESTASFMINGGQLQSQTERNPRRLAM